MEPGVRHTLDLLATARRAVAGFAEREAKHAREAHARRFNAGRAHNERIEQAGQRAAARIEQETARLDAGIQHLVDRCNQREQRVRNAHDLATRRIPRAAREAKHTLTSELQLEKYHTERNAAALIQQAVQTRDEALALIDFIEKRHAQLLASARSAFRGFPSFRALLANPGPLPAAPDSPSAHVALAKSLIDDAAARLGALGRKPAVALFQILPPLVSAPLLLAGIGAAVWQQLPAAVPAALAACGVIAAASQRLTATRALEDAREIARSLAFTAGLRDTCATACADVCDAETQRVNDKASRLLAHIAARTADAESADQRYSDRVSGKINSQLERILTRLHRTRDEQLTRLTAARDGQLALLQATCDSELIRLRDAQAADIAAADAASEAEWEEITRDWSLAITAPYQELRAIAGAVDPASPAWTDEAAATWKPTTDPVLFAKFADLHIDLADRPQGAPVLHDLAFPGPSAITAPLALHLPHDASLVFETDGSGEPEVIGTFNQTIYRLLSALPPGKAAFTIIDPVGLGQNFAGLMHLADHEESLINRKIWTQRDQIDERLDELSEHIEKVIQMYLRNEYATITEYNEQAGSVAEKYHFLVIADFPANFTDSSARRLQSILASGPRCGVFTLLHRDTRQNLPDGFAPEDLPQLATVIRRTHGRFTTSLPADSPATLAFTPPPTDEQALELTQRIGRASIDSNRVEVPFSQIAPAPADRWTGDTTSELRIAIGRTGATKHQYLAIGKGTRQHALFAGKTGSGKSTLFHVIITNLALACSPDQVEFYLIDFKKGVEFKCYAARQLPHARVVAIESEREFALSVLQRLDAELRRRGDLFRKLGVQDLAGYRREAGVEPMPRTLLLIDEFQEFFVEDDTIAQTASLLLDRIVRQGRAFGIHVILGSQTLGGSYSLARATLGQMVIRVALQCNEADAYLIMDENNAAPRLLSRPGEGIYNDSAGAIEGNSPFQVVWLPDEERDQWLDEVNHLAATHGVSFPPPIVFEGNAPADILENQPLATARASTPDSPPATPRIWLGAPNSIKGPTEVLFHRQSGNHLLIVGQRDEAVVTMIGLSLTALAAQFPPGTARFILVHAAPAGSADAAFLDLAASTVTHGLTVSNGSDLAEIMGQLGNELKARQNGESDPAQAPATFVILHGLHRFKKLRQEDEFSFSFGDEAPAANPAAVLQDLINEGSAHGIHLIATVDTLNNVNRCLSRKAQTEFEMRVVFQMSANDSASLIDSPKAANLGLHRALYHNEHEGSLETFRPYAMPGADWFRNP